MTLSTTTATSLTRVVWIALSMWPVVFSGCKTAEINDDQMNPGVYSELKHIDNGEYSLYLSYAEQPNRYEFISCDARVPMEPEVCLDENCSSQISKRPDHCVSAFMSAPQKQYCQVYYALKPRCPEVDEMKRYCADRANQVLPQGFASPLECAPELFETLEKGCPIILPQFAANCDASYHIRYQCQREKNKAQCAKFMQGQSRRFPFLMSAVQLNVSQPQQAALTQQLSYEKYLNLSKNDYQQRFQSFGQGSFFTAIMSGRIFNVMFQAVPASMRRDLVKASLFGRNINVNSAHLVAGVGTGTVAMSMSKDNTSLLTDQNSFFPKVFCSQNSQQQTQIMVPTIVQDNSEVINGILNWVPYAGAGFGTNMFLLKATKRAHPVVKLGGVLIAPFMAFLIARQMDDRAPGVVEDEFASLLVPKTLNAQSQADLNRVNVAMDEVLSVFGRSLIFTRKSTIMTIDQYCLPERGADGTYTAKCAPVFSGDEGSLFSSEYGMRRLKIADVCAPYW